MTYRKHFDRSAARQTQPIPGRESEMVKMASGGFGFKAEDWMMLNRFLMLGTEGGTYYESERKLTLQSAQAVGRCIQADGRRVVAETVKISDSGAAPDNSPAIFVLALCYATGDSATRKAALEALPKVCRIGTHLFEFVSTMKALKNSSTMGRGVRTAVGKWYTDRKANDLALQLIKYRSRFDYSHRDVIRLAHVKGADAWQTAALGWAAGKKDFAETVIPMSKFIGGSELQSKMIYGFELAQAETSPEGWISLIADYNLPREALPTQALNSPPVWEALLQNMPYTATVRNLNKMTALGLFDGAYNQNLKLVLARLTNVEQIKKSRIHPLDILIALKTYALGHGLKGSLTWKPVPKILDALDTAFYASFDNVAPLGQNILIGVDWSASMNHNVSGMEFLTGREVASVMALVYARTNPDTHVIGFATGHHVMDISDKARLDDVLKWIERYGKGEATDVSIPAKYARQNKLPITGILTITDSESWAGDRHVAVEFAELRKERPVRWVNMQTTVQGATLQDPKDKDAMEMAGFSPSFMTVANAFFRGEI